MILDKIFSRSFTSDPAKRTGGIFFGAPTAGVPIDEERALHYSAVYACVKVIAETISIVSWQVHQRSDGFRERLFDHRVARLLNVEPNPEMSPKTFKETLTAHLLLWGNAYAEIDRNGAGDPQALIPIPPDRVKPFRTNSGALAYEVRQDEGESVIIRSEDMFAPIGISKDGLTGYSPIGLARESISMGLAMESFGASFFGNDARPSVALKHPSQLSQEAQQRLKDSFSTQYGGAKNSWKPHVLEEGMEIETIGVPPEDAQFIESRKFQTEEIARWYRVPPHKIQSMERATFNNIDARERSFITEAVLPWARGMEEEANRKLVRTSQRGRIFTKMDLNSLMRGDVQTRSEFYNTMFNVGAFSPNDIRVLEDMNPVRNGNVRMIPGNMTTLGQAGSQVQGTQSETLWDVFADVADRMLGIEYKAVSPRAKQENFKDWLHEFYQEHQARMREAFLPAVSSLAKQHGMDPPEGLLNRVVHAHCRAAVELFEGAEDVEAEAYRWSQRSQEVAGEIMDGVSDALAA